jgi:ketosteroid isomerase-like protein
MTAAEIHALADRFFAAIEAGDVAALGSIYADDATIWHNFDQIDQSVADNLLVLGWMHANLGALRYVDIRRIIVDDGFVQQHLLTGHAAGGPLALPAMMKVTVNDGRITRIEEYLDTAQLAPLRQASAPE